MRMVLGKIKPPWLSWLGLLAIAIQVCFAGLMIYAVVGNYAGYLSPPKKLSDSTQMAALGLAILGLIAAIGMYRNRWAAYALELVLYFALLSALVWLDLPEKPIRNEPLYELPYEMELRAVTNTFVFIMLGWFLIKQTFKLYREQRATPTP